MESIVVTRFVITICCCISLAGCNNSHSVPLSGRIEGLSMAPGLRDGEVVSWVPVQSDAYQRYVPVVCELNNKLVTKRIVGLPGEIIEIIDGELVVDGEMLRKDPPLLQQFGLIVDCQADSWRDLNRSWKQSNNVWICENVSSDQFSWLDFQPQVSRGVVPDIGSLCFYDDVSWLPMETRRLEIVRDVGMSAVLDIDLPEGCGLEIRVKKDGLVARLVVKNDGALAVIAGRLDGQYVVAAWPVIREQQKKFHERGNGKGSGFSDKLPEDWSAQWDISNAQEKSRNESSLALGIKLLSENENASGTVIAEELFIWRDVHWLSVPNKRKWPVPVEHVFVLGDCPAASRDSRHWGPIAIGTIQGKVVQPLSSEPLPFWLHQN